MCESTTYCQAEWLPSGCRVGTVVQEHNRIILDLKHIVSLINVIFEQCWQHTLYIANVGCLTVSDLGRAEPCQGKRLEKI